MIYQQNSDNESGQVSLFGQKLITNFQKLRTESWRLDKRKWNNNRKQK